MERKKPKNSPKEKLKENTKKGYKKTKEAFKEGKQKVDEARKTSTWKKTKRVAKKVARITGSHLAALSASITLSNEESELISKLKNDLNKKKIYPSKSEIIRAGLWNLRKMNAKELENAVKDLVKVKQTRVL
ncbi:MAG: hypothetical protein I3273_04545 [Candidatus Moeniiplasma glomeromycotorum]|nr:hypothetical protein [Candidatus Moeniiplasma glomeromycotorum]MCE8169364.1 hypothetical protein [Candidatus Moeniiplasma glomeromycotorum]